MSVEPTLLPLTDEHLRLRSATTDSDARLDIDASGFYGCRFEQALFDVRFSAPSPARTTAASPQFTGARNKRSDESMVSVCVKLNMLHSCL